MSKLSSNIRKWFASATRLFQSVRRRQRVEGMRVYLMTVLASLVLLIMWGSFAHIDRVVRVSGKIIPAGRSREIQHLEGGIIASITTTEGAAVKRGDLLLTIDDAMAGSNLGETKVRLDAERARAARLSAEAKGEKTIIFPEDLEATEAAKAENALFLSRREKLNQEISIHESTIRQQTAKLAENTKRRSNLTAELQVARSRSNLLSQMAERNAASKLEVLEAKGREQGLQTQISEVETSVPTLREAMEEERSRIEAARAEFVNQAQSDLVTALAEIDRLKQVKISASDRVSRTEIRAPMDGIINRISFNTVGGVVKPGESLIELIPYTNEVLIEAKALPKDRGNLRPGLDATVRVSAYDVGELGVLKSHVTQVSADTVPDGHGDPYYRVNLLVSDLPASYSNHVMVPGMTVTADIVTGKRTVMGMLLSPLRKFTYSMFRDSR